VSVRELDKAYADVLDLLHTRSLEDWDIPALLSEVAGCLGALGMQLCRIHIGRPILHPLFVVGAYTWYQNKEVEFDTYARGPEQEESFRESPVFPTFKSGAFEGRYSIRAGSESDQFPLFVNVAAEGGTDYFLQLTGYADRSSSSAGQEGILISWISAAAGGFSDVEIELLRRVHKPLCVEIKSLTHKILVKDILRAYLGDYSSDRVYSGQIQRGDGDIIDAVIMYCDLRGSSKLAEHYDLDSFLGVLNDYFEVTAGAVIDGGGEVLRYIGDASLAIFPIERYTDEQEACRTALEVALNAVARGDRLNAERSNRGEPPIKFGIGLHCGTVAYGNIGTADRIEFTVIGKAANEAARIEAQCKELNELILVSDSFAGHLNQPWRSHGSFELRNIGRPIEILSPKE
jgi:adenylate cyclase